MNEGYSYDPASYKIIKLVNGEDIICTIEEENKNVSNRKLATLLESSIEVNHPMKMQIVPKMTDKGIAESLSLSHWVHPYTESRSFSIPSSSVILVADVSPGLSRYYEFVLGKIEKELEIDPITDEDVYDELLEEMDVDSDSIH